MLFAIKQLSSAAQQIIMAELPQTNDSETAKIKQLNTLLTYYRQLDILIQKGEEAHASIGLFLLSRQLTNGPEPLNAFNLLEHFSSILKHPLESTFDMHQEPHRMSNIDTAKMFSSFPLLFMFPFITAFLPLIVISGLSTMATALLIFSISALPLAITYYFDKPFETYSMARLYQEMYGLEKMLAYTALFTILILLICIPAMPLLLGFLSISSTLIIGLSLLKHSHILEEKHTHLKKTITNTHNKLACTSLSFFNNHNDAAPDITEKLKTTTFKI